VFSMKIYPAQFIFSSLSFVTMPSWNMQDSIIDAVILSLIKFISLLVKITMDTDC